jgi:hypothetical protein
MNSFTSGNNSVSLKRRRFEHRNIYRRNIFGFALLHLPQREIGLSSRTDSPAPGCFIPLTCNFSTARCSDWATVETPTPRISQIWQYLREKKL